ncbi:hypothetical protein BG015_005212, partial [Linnemannia schmuckeri]
MIILSRFAFIATFLAALTVTLAQIEDHSDEIIDEVLRTHNEIRKAHLVPPLAKMEDDTYVRNRAKQKVGKPMLFSPPGADPKYGEISVRYSSRTGIISGRNVVLAMTKGEDSYDYSKENPSPNF